MSIDLAAGNGLPDYGAVGLAKPPASHQDDMTWACCSPKAALKLLIPLVLLLRCSAQPYATDSRDKNALLAFKAAVADGQEVGLT